MSSEEDLDDDSRWPARLLHVETLTSHPWEPGNIYGGYVRPRYNAISYTWGRFQLPGDQQPEVEAVPIRGTTWEKHLPRIRPESFTVEDMLRVITTAAAPHAGYPAVEFIWLDIACIDQTPNSPEMACEVGRQAMIFRGAVDIFVWLTTLRSPEIIDWVYDMECLVSEQFTIDQDHTPAAVVSAWIVKAAKLFQVFTADDWFTSLWTLQEAFLSPKAIFMFRDGLPLSLIDTTCMDGEGNIQLPRLNSWAQTWYSIKSLVESLPQYPEGGKLMNTIDCVGFLDGMRNQWLTFALDDLEYPSDFMGIPFKLLVASKHRTTRYEDDRIYGIMQVFELRLGKSAPGASGDDFSLDELRTQLAAAVLYKYPILSQLIVQHEDCKPHEAWMISPSMSLPEEASRAWSHLAFGGDVVCRTSMRTEHFRGRLWAGFSGPVSPLSVWHKAMESQADYVNTRLLIDRRWTREVPEYDAATSSGDVKAKFQWLLSMFDSPSVVFLGCLVPPEGTKSDRNMNEFYNWGIGLLLTPGREQDFDHYQRIGVLVWKLDLIMSLRKATISEDIFVYLNGDGNGWTSSAGLIG
ncbi:hypothetical protein VM1G_03518 [Cytospora mali]|uniref:Heterokaryon incompatibility domain-containing protein n=1 Tax=Cytospora mali TaxID=578113 RepID=A0A194VVB4_CYTMA|nr:hypothetical protein VM1G_03518 [Valsa mali]